MRWLLHNTKKQIAYFVIYSHQQGHKQGQTFILLIRNLKLWNGKRLFFYSEGEYTFSFNMENSKSRYL